jgi:regulator of cell morphogenesis and NO signaling
MKITEKNVIGKLVAEDYRTAEVFAKHGIDFCCKGDQTIEAVCRKKNLEADSVVADLNKIVTEKTGENIDFKSWPLDLLADYIEKKHHRYVEQKTPLITQYLTKVCQVHGKAHPELIDIAQLFSSSSHALAAHMKKEELVLFPYIRKMTSGSRSLLPPHFGTVENPIEMMKEEHDMEGERFRMISKLTSGYTPPAEACNTYRVTYALLKEFEQDLHLHIHLENNILFPGAIEFEERLGSVQKHENGQSCAI